MRRFLLINGLVFSLACIIFTSCQKQEISAYSNAPAIYLTNGADSLRYSFAIQPSFIMEDTIWVNVRISGDSAAAARPVSLIAGEGTTAMAGIHYKLPDYNIPANTFDAALPVVVYRSPDLQSKEVAINLQLTANDDFATSFSTADYRAGYRILLNDILTKPTNWESRFEIRFGKYSLRKYQFMINVLGSEIIIQLNEGTLYLNDQFAYRQKMINAWNDYVALHGPMLDENDLPVVF